MYFFSVVIPLFNKERYIKKAIESVLSQTYDNFEIIIVDDGSTDNSYNDVKSFTDKRIRLISQENLGVSFARNRGINEAKYNYIAFLDADDCWRPNHLSNISNLIEKYQSAGLYATGYVLNYGNKNIKPKFNGIPNHDWCGIIGNYYYSATSRHLPINSSNVVIVKSILNELGGFNENDKVGEDHDLWFRIARKYEIAFTTTVSSVYNRITVNNARNIQKIWYPSGYFATLKKALKDNNISESDKKYISYIYERKIIAYIFSLILSGEKRRARTLLETEDIKYHLSFKYMLYIISYLPNKMVKIVHNIRLKVI